MLTTRPQPRSFMCGNAARIAQNGAVVADGDATGHLLVGLLLDAPDAAAAPGVVDEDVQRAVFGNRGGNGILDLVAIGYVGADEVSADFIRNGLARGSVDLGDHDAGPFVGEPPSYALTDSRAGTRDERHLAGQRPVHRFAPITPADNNSRGSALPSRAWVFRSMICQRPSIRRSRK